MDAIKWGLTGKITKEDIRYDSPEASIKIIFDDGTSIMRTQSAKATNYVNEKVATEKATNEFLENKFGCSISSIEAMCGASFFKSLSKKDLKSFIVNEASAMQTAIKTDKSGSRRTLLASYLNA